MFDIKVRSDIGRMNIECAKHWLRENNLVCKHVDVGGYCGRKVRLYTQTGSVEVAHLNKVHIANDISGLPQWGGL